MSEAETTRKRIDVAKPCCGRKRGHAPECKSAPVVSEATPREPVTAEAVATAFRDDTIPRSTFMALLDAFLDDIATRMAAKTRSNDGGYVVRPVDVPALKAVITPSAEHYVIGPKPAPAPAPDVARVQAAAASVNVVEKEKVLEPKPTVVEKGSADAAACDKAKKEYVAPKPCVGCGKDDNAPKDPHSSACTVVEEKKPEPKPAEIAPPAFEVLREAAVEFAQKNSKEKLMDILEKYGAKGPEGVKLSLLPADKRAAFLAEVKP